MKKNLKIVLFLVIGLLAACGQTSTPSPAPVAPPTEATAPTPPPPATAPATAPAAKTETQVIALESGNLYFKPATITVKENQPVRITIANKGGHTFTIKEFGVDVLLNGPSASAIFTPTKTGTFPITCEIPGHKEAGMKGALIVTE